MDIGLQKLDWDSVFFEKDIYNATAENIPSLTPNYFDSRYDDALIQVKLSAHQWALLDQWQALGFQWVESEIGFTKSIEPSLDTNASFEGQVEPAHLEDEAVIADIASHALIHSRYRTPWFDAGAASRFYGQWARNAIHRRYDDVCLKLVSPIDRVIMGFITAKIHRDRRSLRIGLIAVAPMFQNQRGGRILLNHIERWGARQQLTTLDVATQGSNIKAVQFYLKQGFQLNAIQYWLYRCQSSTARN